MRPVDVKSDSYAECNVNNVKGTKHKNIFVKGYTPNW